MRDFKRHGVQSPVSPLATIPDDPSQDPLLKFAEKKGRLGGRRAVSLGYVLVRRLNSFATLDKTSRIIGHPALIGVNGE